MDVEGHELALFQGAERTLRRDHPHILVECEERHLTKHTMTDVFSFLERLGYRVEWREYAMPHSVCMEEVEHIGAWLRRVLKGA